MINKYSLFLIPFHHSGRIYRILIYVLKCTNMLSTISNTIRKSQQSINISLFHSQLCQTSSATYFLLQFPFAYINWNWNERFYPMFASIFASFVFLNNKNIHRSFWFSALLLSKFWHLISFLFLYPERIHIPK